MKVSARATASLPAGPSCVWPPVCVPGCACHSRHLCASLYTARPLATAVARLVGAWAAWGEALPSYPLPCVPFVKRGHLLCYEENKMG